MHTYTRKKTNWFNKSATHCLYAVPYCPTMWRKKNNLKPCCIGSHVLSPFIKADRQVFCEMMCLSQGPGVFSWSFFIYMDMCVCVYTLICINIHIHISTCTYTHLHNKTYKSQTTWVLLWEHILYRYCTASK